MTDPQAPAAQLNLGLPSQSDKAIAIAKALCAAQAEIEPAVKDKINPAFKSSYADLEAVYSACLPALNRAGIVVTGHLHVYPLPPDFLLVLETRLTHAETGEFYSSFFPIVPQKKDLQGTGSALTYARRYSVSTMVCVAAADDDDDANRASGREPPKKAAYSSTNNWDGGSKPRAAAGGGNISAKASGMLKGIAVARDTAALQNFRNMVQTGGFADNELASLREACDVRAQELIRPGSGRADTERALDGF